MNENARKCRELADILCLPPLGRHDENIAGLLRDVANDLDAAVRAQAETEQRVKELEAAIVEADNARIEFVIAGATGDPLFQHQKLTEWNKRAKRLIDMTDAAQEDTQ